MRGMIIRTISEFYYVYAEEQVWACKARGLFRQKSMTPLVGDEVEMHVTHWGDAEGIIESVFPRKNRFLRPAVANVDQVLVLCAASRPDPIPEVLDRFLVMAEDKETEILLCVNKVDLDQEHNLQQLASVYRMLYPFFPVSAVTGDGVDALRGHLAGKKTVMAGPSGVGKSTLLNALRSDTAAKTGMISEKTGRGRHTTRHVELFPLEQGGWIYDTPGFTALDVPDIDEEDLPFLFPEMRPLIGRCRYDNCRHLKEPECAVREAVRSGGIAGSRYASYVSQCAELRNRNRY